MLLLILLISSVAATKNSLTFIIDTSFSMKHEVETIKRHISSVIPEKTDGPIFENYILLPFNYADAPTQEPTLTAHPEEFMRAINKITAGGGKDQDCPEDTLTGIENALELSLPESKIYLFTDAYANDASKVSAVKDLCMRTKSQVVIFLSGTCVEYGTKSAGSVQVYGEIASACSGTLLYFDQVNLIQAFLYLREMIDEDWTDIKAEKPFSGYQQFKLPVTAYTDAVLITVSGDYQTVDVMDPDDRNVEKDMIFNHKQTMVFRLQNLSSGDYKINVQSNGIAGITFYVSNQFPFEYGFAPKQLNRPRSLRETSKLPMPAWTNNVLISLPESNKMRPDVVEFVYLDDSRSSKLSLEEIKQSTGSLTFMTNLFFIPEKAFQMTVSGIYLDTNTTFSITSDILRPQTQVKNVEWSKPTVEILDGDITVEYETSAVLACIVVGFPRPTISWKSAGKELTTVETIFLEIPSMYISYLNLDSVTSDGSYECVARNTKGDSSQSVKVHPFRRNFFRVIEEPKDTSIEYGTSGTLHCVVKAYPEATTKWYRNDKQIENFSTNVKFQRDSLSIVNMNLTDVGSYSCEVSNSVETQKFTANVEIAGVEKPEIDTFTESTINLKLGMSESAECKVSSGKPEPTITWSFQPDGTSEFSEVPYDVEISGGTIRFSDVKREHKGTYRCEVSNIVGSDARDYNVKVQYPPIIKDADIARTIVVHEGSDVEIPCQVDADPKASVTWQHFQNNKALPFNERHYTDDMNTHRFSAYGNDSGEYRCIAENEIGETVKIIPVNVLVPPYIEAPYSDEISVHLGGSISLPCVLLHGNPPPRVHWEFAPLRGTRMVIERSVTPLVLSNVTSSDEGTYYCIARNLVRSDRIKIYVRVL